LNTFALSLLFLSPVIGYATLILLQENSDPLRGFHDNFQRNIVEGNISTQTNKYNLIRTARNRVIIFAFACSLTLLILIGASATTIVLMAVGILSYFYWEKGALDREKERERQRAEEEFPAIVELFTVLVSAGESPSTSLLRVSQRSSGVLAENFSEVLSDLHSGKNLTQSLEALGAVINSPTIRRFCDTLILAIERGTSLSDVLARQVEEVRNAHHAALLTAAGKAEIALMVPVIFLILPISVIFALWPSYISLGQSVM